MIPPSDFPLKSFIDQFMAQEGSDLYCISGCKPTMRMGGKMITLQETALTPESISESLHSLLDADERAQFQQHMELDTAIGWGSKGRLRLNVYRQQQQPCLVMRRISTHVPDITSLNLPPVYAHLAMEKRGLVLLTGPTGSGKSTSQAAMIHHRNQQMTGHIVTIEDPIEYVHTPLQCIISQRDVGIDTMSVKEALKHALRQRPDMIVIGELRDVETTEQAIAFAETGHLVMATLHSNNANQAVERVINFFPEDHHAHILLNLSLNLRAVLAQRLVPGMHQEPILATEVLINHGLISELLQQGRIREIKDQIEKSHSEGGHSFDQSLLALYHAGTISEETALAQADNPANMRLLFKQLSIEKRLAGGGNTSPRSSGQSSSAD